MEKYYEIDKIAVVLFLPCFEVTSVYDYYESNMFVRQFIYEDNGCLIDIFRDKYIASIYNNGRMPSFNYNSSNKLRKELFTKEELRSGMVSYDRLLEIYCIYNFSFITYNDALRQDEFRSNKSIFDISRYRLRRKKSNKRKESDL
jgi:hypothetical protein